MRSETLSGLRLSWNKSRFLKLVDAEILRAEAREQARVAEERFVAEHSDSIDHVEELARCGADRLHWFDNWCWTYDPRLVGQPGGAFIPFKPWPRQREFLLWLQERKAANEPWLLQKSRDQGATYLIAGDALHDWLFVPGSKITFGSRVEDLVDNRNNPDSIFEKVRIILRRLPPWMLPNGFSWHSHDLNFNLVNPANGASITGEGGKNMGRGGRSSMYVLDEAAFVEHAETVEAAISANAECIGYVSSVNNAGDFFDKKRLNNMLEPRQIFTLYWRDDPRKSDEWAEKKKRTLTDPTAWEREYEINSAASAEGICIPAQYVKSAKLLPTLVPALLKQPRINGRAGGDVGGGKAKSILVERFGPLIPPAYVRREADTTDTALWMLRNCKADGVIALNYDNVGIGAGVQSTMRHTSAPELRSVERFGINVGEPPSNRVWPDGKTSEQMFPNLKAEIWWLARQAFVRTHEHVLFLQGKEGGIKHPLCDLIALVEDPRDNSLSTQLSLVKYRKDEKGKIAIESKDSLRKRSIASPDYAEAFVLTFIESEDSGIPNISLGDDLRRTNPFAIGSSGGEDYGDS